MKMISQKAKIVFFSNLNTFANITLGQILICFMRKIMFLFASMFLTIKSDLDKMWVDFLRANKFLGEKFAGKSSKTIITNEQNKKCFYFSFELF